ncbi:MAG: lysozyme [Erythrobacter sp.]
MRRKPVFDLVRRLLGRGFRPSEVAALDAALDRAEYDALDSGACGAAALPQHVSEAGIALIRRFESCASLRPDGLVEAYPDPGTGGAPWTIGWGATGPDIGPDTVWTQAQCDARLIEDIERHATDVRKALAGAPVSQAQFDALVSFHYNTGAIARATLTARHRAGDYTAATEEFARWNRAEGRVLKGLTRRRLAEAALYAEREQA